MSTSDDRIRNIVEAALLAAGRPLSIDRLLSLFVDGEQPERQEVRTALDQLAADYEGRGIEVKEVASGWRIQVSSEWAPWVSRLWEEKPPRYSRALMETLALIAYRQPITRGEIEDIRGVAVSTNIVKTLLEREWVRVVGHRDVPGKPALYATTREFLDYFGLGSLEDLPTLGEIKDLESLNQEFQFGEQPAPETAADGAEAEQPGDETDTPPDVSDGDENADQLDAAAGEVQTGGEDDAEDADTVKAADQPVESTPGSDEETGFAVAGDVPTEDEDAAETVPPAPHVTH